MRILILTLVLIPALSGCGTEPRTDRETGDAGQPEGGGLGGLGGGAEGEFAGEDGASDAGGPGGGEVPEGGDEGGGQGEGNPDGGAPGEGGGEGEGEPGQGEGEGEPGQGEGEGEPGQGEGEGEPGQGEGEGEPGQGEGEGEPGQGEGEGEPGQGEGEGEPGQGEGEGEPPFGECREGGDCAPHFMHCAVCDWLCLPAGEPVADCRNLCPNENNRGEPPQCKCEDGACRAVPVDPPRPAECADDVACAPFLDHCNCDWTCRPDGQFGDCDALCPEEVEDGPRPVCECAPAGGCEMWQPRCSSDAHCAEGERCWLTRICGMGPDGLHCGDFQGDGQCHPPCDDGECGGDDQCAQITIWHGDAGEVAALCIPERECGDPIGGCAIGHRPGACCGCGQPMTADEIGGDQCITPEFDDPVPPRCQRDDCDEVDCAQCFQPNRAACAGATCVAFEQVR